MNKEDYVSLEVAKLLKEKGFNEYCGAYYHLNWEDMTEEECFEVSPNHDFRNKDNGYRVGAPTLYEAQKWLRDKHKVYVSSLPTKECGKTIWYHQITKDVLSDGIYGTVSDEDFTSHEEALNAGILEAIKLI